MGHGDILPSGRHRLGVCLVVEQGMLQMVAGGYAKYNVSSDIGLEIKSRVALEMGSDCGILH